MSVCIRVVVIAVILLLPLILFAVMFFLLFLLLLLSVSMFVAVVLGCSILSCFPFLYNLLYQYIEFVTARS